MSPAMWRTWGSIFLLLRPGSSIIAEPNHYESVYVICKGLPNFFTIRKMTCSQPKAVYYMTTMTTMTTKTP